MNTNRELLELAAKAAGYSVRYVSDGKGGGSFYMEPSQLYWNPKDDDGDALRLAAALVMDFRWDFADCELRAACIQQGRLGHPCGGQGSEIFEKYTVDEDNAAVYRRAAVRLAASIGEAT